MARTTAISKVIPLPTLENLLTLKEVAQILKVDRTEVYRLIEEEGLPIVPFGRNKLNRRVRPTGLALWLEKREEATGKEEETRGTYKETGARTR